VRAVRETSSLPIAVGFGISLPEQARRNRGVADGVVVGGALVRLIEEHAASPGLEERVAVLPGYEGGAGNVSACGRGS